AEVPLPVRSALPGPDRLDRSQPCHWDHEIPGLNAIRCLSVALVLNLDQVADDGVESVGVEIHVEADDLLLCEAHRHLPNVRRAGQCDDHCCFRFRQRLPVGVAHHHLAMDVETRVADPVEFRAYSGTPSMTSARVRICLPSSITSATDKPSRA